MGKNRSSTNALAHYENCASYACDSTVQSFGVGFSIIDLVMDKVGEGIYMADLLERKNTYIVNKIKFESMQILT